MTIEVKEKGTKAFYEEIVNVSSQYRRLLKKPDAKLVNNFRLLKTYIVVCAAFLVALALMGAFWGVDTLTVVAMAVMAIAIGFSWAFLHNMNNLVKTNLADARPSKVTLDEEGVEINKEGAQVVRLAWDSVAFVRAFDESVCFVSKDLTGFVIAVTNARKDEILGYLSSTGLTVKVIK